MRVRRLDLSHTEICVTRKIGTTWSFQEFVPGPSFVAFTYQDQGEVDTATQIDFMSFGLNIT